MPPNCAMCHCVVVMSGDGHVVPLVSTMAYKNAVVFAVERCKESRSWLVDTGRKGAVTDAIWRDA